MNLIAATMGIKGMKATIAGGITSFVSGSIAFAFSTPHTVIADIAAVVGICVGMMTIWHIWLQTKKTRSETLRSELETDLIFSRCKNCETPENCVFKEEHKPIKCKYRGKK